MWSLLPALIVLGTGCGPDDETATEPGPPPPFTWTDTAVYTDYEPWPRFDGAPPKNLLMISIDTLRRDHLGRYGGPVDTPFLDGLAEQGVPLDDFVQCSSWTFASTACTLMGRGNVEARHMPRLTKIPQPLPPTPTLATALADAGFDTMLVSSNPWLSPLSNNAQGYARALTPESPQRVSEVVDSGLTLMEDVTADRWLLHLHVTEPHAPYDPPAEYLDLSGLDPLPWDVTTRDAHYATTELWPEMTEAERQLLEAHLRARYAAEVRWLDDALSAAWDRLDAAGLLDDTLVVLWTDHGEQFWEHGQQSHAWHLYAEENDAVAVFWAPNVVPGAWTGPTSSVDLVPTILDVFEVAPPEGLSGVPLGAARPDRTRFTTVAARGGVSQAILRDGQKLHYHWPTGRVEWFDRAADPGDAHDLSTPGDPDVQALWEALEPRVLATEPLVPDATRVPPAL